MVIPQEPTEPQAAAHVAALGSQRFGDNESVANPLVIPLSMVVFEECAQGLPEADLAEGHQAFQTFFLDGPHKSLRVGIAVRRLIRRLHDADASVREQAPKCPAPLGITVADQNSVTQQRPVARVRPRASDLTHERLVGLWRRSGDVDSP
jgi:hypothetical protein